MVEKEGLHAHHIHKFPKYNKEGRKIGKIFIYININNFKDRNIILFIGCIVTSFLEIEEFLRLYLAAFKLLSYLLIDLVRVF